MHKLKYKLAIDKTYIGKICKGFDFLGYHFNENGSIGLAGRTIRNFIENTARLYEQNATSDRISMYVKRWVGWVCT